MGAAGAIMSLASVGFSAFGSMESAQGTAQADQFKAEQLQREAEYGRLQATQTNAEMTRNLNSTLANIDAVRAARHDSPLSPTGEAVRGQTEAALSEDKTIKVDSIMAQAQMQDDEAAYMRHASSQAMLGGEIGAGAAVFKGLAGLFGA